MLTAAAPLRLILVSGAESRREFVELSISVQLDADLPLEQVHHTIRSTVTLANQELEAVALAMAHRVLDTEQSVGHALVTITAPRWRHINARVKQHAGGELRLASAKVTRAGEATVEAALRYLTLISGAKPDLSTWDIEWQYRKAAGISFRPAWAAIRKLVLDACIEQQEPQAVADLIVNEVEDIASARVLRTRESFRLAAEDEGLWIPTDQLERQTASAAAAK